MVATTEEPVELAKLTRLKLSLQGKLDTISKLDDEIFELIENESQLVHGSSQKIFPEWYYLNLIN